MELPVSKAAKYAKIEGQGLKMEFCIWLFCCCCLFFNLKNVIGEVWLIHDIC